MLRLSMLCAALLAPALAMAQPVRGPYVSGAAGVNFADTLESSQGTTNIFTGPGPLALGAFGWRFGDGLRAEIEASYRSNGISGIETLRINRSLVPLAEVSGNTAIYALMTNLFYDIPGDFPVRPYIGAGVRYKFGRN